MDRDCPNGFLKADHADCPFCAEHMTARVVENLLKGKVEDANSKWKELRIHYSIKKKPQGQGEGYKDPSCKGKVARDLLRKVEEWLPPLLKPGEEQILELWVVFRRMVETARAYHPDFQRINEFKTYAARFFLLHRLRLTDDGFAYYIHTCCFHGNCQSMCYAII
eukprot:TRINITY_DN319_c0_g1_i4.p1 TRINITY_DN319_c0_g1~~TRINITY_DN319_c0_g1_i4.p1  ORF type:complete len:165 (-),score=43.88 TRINITY_DN319_c0_g1_i4:712-1206(-)